MIFKEKQKNEGRLNKLLNSEEYKKHQAEQDAELQKRKQVMSNEQRLILKELRDIGYDVDTLSYFVNTNENYKSAIPVFKKYLKTDFSKYTKESIIRSLAVRWYNDPEIVDVLFELFKNEKYENARWIIGNTISVAIKNKEQADKALSILKSGKYGGSADMLIEGYARIYKDNAIPDILEFIKDKDKGIRNQSIIALGKLKSKEARPYIEPYLTNEDSWVRNKAKAAIKKIDNAK